MSHGESLLSKVLDDGNVDALRRFSIEQTDFGTEGERDVYKFITDYAQENRGQAPDYRTVVEKFPEFIYRAEDAGRVEWLARQVKEESGIKRISALIGGDKAQQLHAKKDFQNLSELLISELQSIKMRTSVRDTVGRTLDEIAVTMREEYEDREKGKSNRSFATPFPTFTKEVGDWYTGDVYGITGESGRGKTYLICKIIDSLLRQGANTLVKSFEVKEYTWIARLISVATAVDGVLLDNMSRKIGVPNKRILAGKLDEESREKFFDMLDVLNDYYPGTLYFQGKSGKELTRSLNDLERELTTVKVDAVVLDPFYGLSDVYGNNANKTAGGAAEQAATRFENICGDYDVIGFYTVQSTVDKPSVDENGIRELEIPTRDQIKTSKRLLDIATVLIGFDSVEKEGIAAIGVSKGRNGGEDFMLELLALFDYGVINETDLKSESAKFIDDPTGLF